MSPETTVSYPNDHLVAASNTVFPLDLFRQNHRQGAPVEFDERPPLRQEPAPLEAEHGVRQALRISD